MPIYDYQCDSCNDVQEVQHKMSESGPDTCAACGKGPMKKILSAPAFMLKGGGWYSYVYSTSTAKSGNKSADSAPCSSSGSCTSAES